MVIKMEEEKRVATTALLAKLSQALHMDELGGSWGQQTVMAFIDDYETPHLVIHYSLHLQPPPHPY